MVTILKWLFAAVGTAIAWLITSYTVEYLRPYKRK
jgi:NADH:ubiquinone oxidoreductase subunit 5 (subunit L)/multisubunit Na+/H+ antiporter MnhA subunit